MQTDAQMLSKGFYQYAQLDRFIAVKNYIFLRDHGKKGLLLRLYNDMDYPVDHMEFTIVQMDAAGKILERTPVVCKKIKFYPGNTYTLKEAVIVHELCNDFKIVFDEVRAGRYTYYVKDGGAVAYFDLPPKRESQGATLAADIYESELSVKKKKYGRPAAAAWLAILMLLLLVAWNAYHIYRVEMDRREAIKNKHQQIITYSLSNDLTVE